MLTKLQFLFYQHKGIVIKLINIKFILSIRIAQNLASADRTADNLKLNEYIFFIHHKNYIFENLLYYIFEIADAKALNQFC